MSNPVKLSWIERAKETHNFHVSKVREDRKWKRADTARALKRSLGSISEDLLIASWMRTHRSQLERFDYAKDALVWIRKREIQLETEEIE